MASLATSVETPPSIDAETWADATSRELLAVQAQNRQLPPEERAELVEQRLRERIAAVAERGRRDCLRSLAARFPLPHSAADVTAAAAPAEPSPPTPESWVAAFDRVKDGLTPELARALLEKLQGAGLLPTAPAPSATGIPVPAAVEPLLPKASYDPARVAQLVDVVLEAIRGLDGNFRRVWEGVAEFGKTDHGLPRTAVEEVMKRFLGGDQDVPRVMLKTRIETTTKLIPAVLIAVKESWDKMESDVAECLPEEIQKRVKKTTFGYETGCWKEYTRAAERLHPDTRVQEFFAHIVTKARVHIPR